MLGLKVTHSGPRYSWMKQCEASASVSSERNTSFRLSPLTSDTLPSCHRDKNSRMVFQQTQHTNNHIQTCYIQSNENRNTLKKCKRLRVAYILMSFFTTLCLRKGFCSTNTTMQVYKSTIVNSCF